MKHDDLTVAEALERILATVDILEPERVPLLDALGRVLAADVVAQNSLPPFTNSAMDGYALRAADVTAATPSTPASLRVVGDIAAGMWPDRLYIGQGEAARIMTGAPLPPGADAIIPVEMTDENWRSEARPLPDKIAVFQAVNTSDYVRPEGDDVTVGDVILRTGLVIRPAAISVMASLGVSQVDVIRRPLVGIVATGDELVEPDQPLAPGKIRNSNGYAQAAQVAAIGAIPLQLGIGRDTEADMREKLQAGLDAGVDLFVSSAGVSVGAYDVVKTVLDADGDVNFWRVRMRPGKPLAFGTYKGVPYLGLPGNPVSSMVSFWRFGRAALRKMMGLALVDDTAVTVTMSEPMTSDGRESYIRVIIEKVGDDYHAQTTGGQASHIITSLVNANALVVIPEGVTETQAGDRLQGYWLGR